MRSGTRQRLLCCWTGTHGSQFDLAHAASTLSARTTVTESKPVEARIVQQQHSITMLLLDSLHSPFHIEAIYEGLGHFVAGCHICALCALLALSLPRPVPSSIERRLIHL